MAAENVDQEAGIRRRGQRADLDVEAIEQHPLMEGGDEGDGMEEGSADRGVPRVVSSQMRESLMRGEFQHLDPEARAQVLREGLLLARATNVRGTHPSRPPSPAPKLSQRVKDACVSCMGSFSMAMAGCMAVGFMVSARLWHGVLRRFRRFMGWQEPTDDFEVQPGSRRRETPERRCGQAPTGDTDSE